MFLVGVFGRDADRVEVERVIVILGEPQDGFMPPGKTFLAMQSMSKGPNYSVPQAQAVVLENGIEDRVQWEYFTLIYVIADLPAY